MNYTVEKIAWIDCIFAPMNDIHSVTVQVMCKAWSTYETAEQNWIAHCVEHMFFKWWERYKNEKEVVEVLDSIWADYNAWTGSDTVEYYIKCAPEFIEKAIDVLSDMLINANFNENDLEKEKWVIIQEMKLKEDNPPRLVFDKWKPWFFGENSFWRPTLWSEKTVLSFTQSDLKNYKDSLYTKDNLVIAIAGNWAEKEEIKELIVKYFWGMKDKKSVNQPTFPNHHPNSKESFFKKWTEQNHLLICADGILWTDERRYAAKVLAWILWWNHSSRLYQNIRIKEWLCYYINAYHWDSPYHWIFMIRAWMDKNRFDFWLKRIREEITNLSKNGVDKEEFENTIWYLQWQLQMWIETSDDMASFLWEQYLIYNEIETLENMLEKYKKLTLDEVNQLGWMLSLDNCYTFYIE